MTDVALLIADMVKEGVSPEMIGRVAAALAARDVVAVPVKDEAAERRREKDRDRKRNVRGILRTSAESADPSPTPLSKKPTPFSPPKGGQFPPSEPDVAEQIWSLQPVVGGKRRSAKPDVSSALAAAVKRGGVALQILGACQRYYRLPDCTKDGGTFAKGAAVLLNADRWREYLPAPKAQPPPGPATPEQVAKRLRHLHETGEWLPAWGPQPEPARQTA